MLISLFDVRVSYIVLNFCNIYGNVFIKALIRHEFCIMTAVLLTHTVNSTALSWFDHICLHVPEAENIRESSHFESLH